MPHFQIRSQGEPRYVVRLASCTRQHAEVALASILESTGTPKDLAIFEVERLYDDPPPRRSWLRRLFGRG